VPRVKKTRVKPGVGPPVTPLGAPSTIPLFAEGPAWTSVGPGWRPLFGKYRELGFSFEWHDLELCLNLDGTAKVTDGRQSVEIQAQTFAYYFQGEPPLAATRSGGEAHRFITIEYSPKFLQDNFRSQADNVHPLVRAVVRGEAVESMVAPPEGSLLRCTNWWRD
jgi:hypothetical protein